MFYQRHTYYLNGEGKNYTHRSLRETMLNNKVDFFSQL